MGRPHRCLLPHGQRIGQPRIVSDAFRSVARRYGRAALLVNVGGLIACSSSI